MKLRIAAALAVALAGCSRPAPMPDAFAESLGAWHRTGPVRDLPVKEPPDALPVQSIEAIRAASYEGPGKLEARIYALPNSSVALDVVQRWTPRADTVFFYKDRFFVVVQWQAAPKKELQPFLSALEKRFPSAPL